METAQTLFEVEQCGAVTSPVMTSPEVASPEMTSPKSPEVTGNDVTGNEREIISRVFPGTPLDSRYEQWN